MTLVPCGLCRRHVVDRETRCPFCRHERDAQPVPLRVTLGRYSRAAVFSGLAACWSGSSAEPTPPAADPPANRQAPTRPRQGVYGVVTNRKTGAFEPNVVIRFYAIDHTVEARTNDKGQYSVELRPVDYTVQFYFADGTQMATSRLLSALPPGTAERLDMPIEPVPMPMPMPYGAPPARRRVV